MRTWKLHSIATAGVLTSVLACGASPGGGGDADVHGKGNAPTPTGTGTASTPQPMPTQAPPTEALRQLDVGAEHTCAVIEGRVKCWGYGGSGALGYGDTMNRGEAANQMGVNLPAVDLGTGVLAKSVHAGYRHTCALLTDGHVKCWGSGSLGIGVTDARGDEPNEMGNYLPLVDLGVGRTAKALFAGELATCALLDNDGLKCWGKNSVGVLGLGDRVSRGDAPNQMGDNLPYVQLGAGRFVKDLAIGMVHACAVLDDQTVKCWGENMVGQLGQGTYTLPIGISPNEVANLPPVNLGSGRTAKAVAVGDYHSCVILDNDTVKCWGENRSGQLGLGDQRIRGSRPNEMGDNLMPVDLGPGRTAKRITATMDSTCVITDDDNVKCWGDDSLGRLGAEGARNRGSAPNQMGANLPGVNLGIGRHVRALYSGYIGTSCAVLDNADVKCWGFNGQGQLGLGDTVHRGITADQMGDNLPVVNLTGP